MSLRARLRRCLASARACACAARAAAAPPSSSASSRRRHASVAHTSRSAPSSLPYDDTSSARTHYVLISQRLFSANSSRTHKCDYVTRSFMSEYRYNSIESSDTDLMSEPLFYATLRYNTSDRSRSENAFRRTCQSPIITNPLHFTMPILCIYRRAPRMACRACAARGPGAACAGAR